ncbi:hypothetical protein [Neisseria meningitidis]|uniref:hypothetical protein n=1 Tax=Neisseria meningitidis TaxID=487 RepID=UPI000F849442|nr:hypothetical protein [Neisseria meningitidis]
MPETVIPAQAGIPTSAFQQYLKVSVNPNFHIPDRAETTAFDPKTYGSSCPLLRFLQLSAYPALGKNQKNR